MSFSTLHGYNLGRRDRAADYVAPIMPLQPQPSWVDKLAEGAGQGLGQGIQQQIADRLESSALERAIGRISPEMSVLEQHRALANQSPAARNYYNANIAPQLQKEQEYTTKRQQGQALANLLSGSPTGATPGGITGVSGQPTQPGEGQQQAPRKIEDLSDAELNSLYATMDPNQQIQFAKLVEDRKKANLEERKFADTKLARKIASEEEISTPIIKNSHEARHATQARLHAANEIIASTQQGNLGLGLDYLADLTNAENLRTPFGVRFKSAQKEALISNINKIPGGRPNMWVEQQVAGAVPQMGRSREANLTNGLAMKAGADTDQMYIDELDRLSDQYRNDPKYGYVPANIEAQVMKNIAPAVKERQDVLAYQLRKVHEQEHPQSILSKKHVPYGTPLTLKKAEFFLAEANGDVDLAEKLAIQHGYTIPPDNIIEQGEKP